VHSSCLDYLCAGPWQFVVYASGPCSHFFVATLALGVPKFVKNDIVNLRVCHAVHGLRIEDRDMQLWNSDRDVARFGQAVVFPLSSTRTPEHPTLRELLSHLGQAH